MFENICVDETNSISATAKPITKEKKKGKPGITYITVEKKVPGITAHLSRKGSSRTITLHIERILSDDEKGFANAGNKPQFCAELDEVIAGIPLNLSTQILPNIVTRSWLRSVAFEYRRQDLYCDIFMDAEFIGYMTGAFECLEDYLTSRCRTVIEYPVFTLLKRASKSMMRMMSKPERYIHDYSGHSLLQNKGTICRAPGLSINHEDMHPIEQLMFPTSHTFRGRDEVRMDTLPVLTRFLPSTQVGVIHTHRPNREHTQHELTIRSRALFGEEETEYTRIFDGLQLLSFRSIGITISGHAHPKAKRLIITSRYSMSYHREASFALTPACRIRTLNREAVELLEDRNYVESQELACSSLELLQTQDEVFIQVDGNKEWKKLYHKHSILVKHKDIVDSYHKRLTQLDDKYDWNLWRAQIEDVTYIALKDKMILQSTVGTGKTRIIIAAQTLLNNMDPLTIAEPGLLTEFLKEFDKLKMDRPTVIKSEHQLHGHRSEYNIISYTSLNKVIRDPFIARELTKVRESDEDQSMLYHMLLNKFGFICIDESHNLKNPNSIRYKQVRRLKPKRLMLCSGTISSGDPRSIFHQVALLSTSNDGPDLIKTDGTFGPIQLGYNSLFKFLLTRIRIGASKYLDVIKSDREWCHLMDSYITYTDKDSPKVANSVSFKKAEFRKSYCEPTQEHMSLFASNVHKFKCWLTDDAKENDSLEILSRMRLLSDITNCPQLSTVEQNTGYKQVEPINKQKELLRIVDNCVSNKDQVIVFTERKETAAFISDYITSNSQSYAMVSNTAGENIKVRNAKLDKFRQGSADVLVGTYKAIGRGYNIPQASVVILYELFWTPDIMEQAVGRVLREQQRKDPVVYIIITKGMIDEYQFDEIVSTRLRNLEVMIKGKASRDVIQNIRSYKEVAKDMIDRMQTETGEEHDVNENKLMRINEASEIPDLSLIGLTDICNNQSEPINALRDSTVGRIFEKPNLLDAMYGDKINDRPTATNLYFSFWSNIEYAVYGPGMTILDEFLPLGIKFRLDHEFCKRFREITNSHNKKYNPKKNHGKHNKSKLFKNVESSLEEVYVNPLNLATIGLSRDVLWRFSSNAISFNKGEEREDRYEAYGATSKLRKQLSTDLIDTAKGYFKSLGQETTRITTVSMENISPKIIQMRKNPDDIIRPNYHYSELKNDHHMEKPSESRACFLLDPYLICDPEHPNYSTIQRSLYHKRFTSSIVNEQPVPQESRNVRNLNQRSELSPVHMELDPYLGIGYAFNPRFLDYYIIDTNPYKLVSKIASELAMQMNSYYNITYDIANALVSSRETDTKIYKLSTNNQSIYLYPRIIRGTDCTIMYEAMNKYLNVFPLTIHEKDEEA